MSTLRSNDGVNNGTEFEPITAMVLVVMPHIT